MVGLRAILLYVLLLLAIRLSVLNSLNTSFISRLLPLSIQLNSKAESQFGYTANYPGLLSSRPSITVSVPAIAKQVTVRILTNSRMGSGVIIERQGQTYTVVTCAHVVADTEDNRYTLLTADGQTHTGQWLRSTKFPNLDLAVMQFTSNRDYQVAAIADSKALAIGDPVYASGFPNWHWINSNEIEETRKWGPSAFRLTTGKVEMLPNKSLQEGYQLGYTNEIELGMSGGPVLDKYGRLIGINGRLKYPPQGIIAFIFADGTAPSEELFQQMEALSWAVPSATFSKRQSNY